MTARMTRAAKLLDHDEDASDSYTAVYTSGDDTPHLTIIELPTADWVDLGRPDQITVTIEPGDKLNEQATP